MGYLNPSVSQMQDGEATKLPETPYQSPTFDRDVTIKIREPVGSASISPSGRDVVLASRDGLNIIDLDAPYAVPHNLAHQTPWDVADVQWSPHACRDSWIVSTSSQRVLVWNLHLPQTESPIEHILHGHDRAVTDINFSPHHPDVLATCSIDSNIHCWDLRIPERPCETFTAWNAGATQVKWNRQDRNIFASSHDEKLCIWDVRRGRDPLVTLNAHKTKIYGIDWNRYSPYQIITCSLDRTIKSWDLTSESPASCQHVIATAYPVWRARHTPFGHGLLVMPQRESNNLFLYDVRRAKDGGKYYPVTSFAGHEKPVKEFLWRVRGDFATGNDERDFQLISWGRDQQLRLHRIRKELLQQVGFLKGGSAEYKFNMTRRGAVYRTFTTRLSMEYQEETQVKSPDGLGGPSELTKLLKQNTLGLVFGGRPEKAASTSLQPSMSYRLTDPYGKKKEVNVIDWMKNVSIAKQEIGSLESENILEKDTSLTDQKRQISGSLDRPEDLGDEIAVVGEKYSKVEFEKVDIRRRYIVFLLWGPWGVDDELIAVRTAVHFPRGYPNTAVPYFSIDESSAFKSRPIPHLKDDLIGISRDYISHGLPCLDPCVSYLLGESTRSKLTAHLKVLKAEARANDVELDDGSSSDDDTDDNLILGLQAEDMAGSTASVVKANIVPIRRTCGASWLRNGQLVMFSPTPSNIEEPKKPNFESSTFLFHSSNRGGYRAGSRFQDFKSVARLHCFEETEDDEDWSSSESSSSSGETSRRTENVVTFTPMRVTKWQSRTPRSAESSSRVNGGNSLKQSQRQLSSVRILDLENLLPAKRFLANGYRISGRIGEVGMHNAAVAASCGFSDLSDVWILISQLLEEGSVGGNEKSWPPNKAFTKSGHMGIQKRLESRHRAEFVPSPSAKESVFWSNHPLASAWLIPLLFNEFEKLGDVQMLAMLACAFEGIECKPFEAHAHSVDSALCSTAAALERVYLHGEPHEPFDNSSTKLPFMCEPDKVLPLDLNSRPVTSPATPDDTVRGWVPQLEDGIDLDSATFDGSMSSVFAALQTNSCSSTHHMVEATADVEHSLDYQSQTPELIPASPSSSSSDTAPAAPIENIYSLNAQPPTSSAVPMEGKLTLHNQHCFETDFSSPSIPLLDPALRSRFVNFRHAYAELLHAWGLDEQASEVMNFDIIAKSDERWRTSDMRRKSTPTGALEGLRLDVAAAQEGLWRGKRTAPKLVCETCSRRVDGECVPCLKCSHVAHVKCWTDVVLVLGVCAVPGCMCECPRLEELKPNEDARKGGSEKGRKKP